MWTLLLNICWHFKAVNKIIRCFFTFNSVDFTLAIQIKHQATVVQIQHRQRIKPCFLCLLSLIWLPRVSVSIACSQILCSNPKVKEGRGSETLTRLQSSPLSTVPLKYDTLTKCFLSTDSSSVSGKKLKKIIFNDYLPWETIKQPHLNKV